MGSADTLRQIIVKPADEAIEHLKDREYILRRFSQRSLYPLRAALYQATVVSAKFVLQVYGCRTLSEALGSRRIIP